MPRERLGRPGLGQALGGALHVGARDGAVGAARLHEIEIDVELARQRAHRGQDLKRLGPRRLARRLRRLASGLLLAQLADDRARVRFRPLGELDQRRAHLHQIALGAEQPGDAAALRRWHLDDGLVGLDRHQRLVGDHVIALGDVPGDDLGLLEAFPEIRQEELAHGSLRCGSGELADPARGRDDAVDRGHVVLLEPRQRDHRVVAGDARDRARAATSGRARR